ncbi:MAG: NADPH-dependent reductase [Thermoleophilia bacterium]|nr:NADPH-dependent reductase [Thermoleophilia bacterium]
MPLLQVFIASTRPGRKGAAIAEWAAQRAVSHGAFEVEMVDLQEVNLPNYDEPNHPATGKYIHDHTKRWAERVAKADAFVFVIPEYNFFAPPALINAITFLSREWQYKPAGLVSYGGVSAGLRSAQSLKQLLTSVRIMPLPQAVSLPFVDQFLEDGVVKPNEIMLQSSAAMYDELARWEIALRNMRRGL